MKRCCLFTVLCTCITAMLSAKTYVLKPLVFRDPAGSYTANELSSYLFSNEPYINAKGGEVMWLETELPPVMGEPFVLQFNAETFMKADVYQEQSNGSWALIGRTGSSYSLRKTDLTKMKSVPTWQQAVTLPQGQSGRLRIRIEPVKYAAVSIKLVPSPEHFRQESLQSLLLGIVIGVFFCAALLVFAGGLFFKESFYMYISGVIFCLIGHILSVQGIGSAYFWPWLTESGKAENVIFFFSLGALFCGAGALLSDNLNVFPLKHRSGIINISFLVCMSVMLIQFLVLNQNYIQSPLTIIIVCIMGLFLYVCARTSFFQTNNDRHMYWAWSFAVLLIIIRQIFHVLRAKSELPLFRIFDNDMDWPICTGIIIVIIPTGRNIVVRLRGKIAQLEIEMADADDRTKTANSRSYAYSRVIFSLMDPMTLILNAIDSPLSGVNDQTRKTVKKSSMTMMSLLNTLFSLSHYESGIADINENNEPIMLLPFMMSSVEYQIRDIKAKGNLPEIKRGMPASTAVLADKMLLGIFFQYMLEPVRMYASSGTPILIYLDYKNSVLTYSVHITSAPLSEYDARNILDLDYIKNPSKNDDKEHFNKIMASWGIQLHIAKRIVTLYGGSISILPDPLGNTFVAQFMLKPAVLTIKAESVTEQTENDDEQTTGKNGQTIIQRRPHALHPETILIIESNSDMRTALSDMFKQTYKTVTSVNGQEAYALLQNFTPDLIIASDNLPVLSGEDLLKFCCKENRLRSIPFFFMTGFSESRRRLSLYNAGAVEVIEKPFLPDELLAKVNAFMENRRTVKSLVLSDISNAVRQGLTVSQPEQQNAYSSDLGREQGTLPQQGIPAHVQPDAPAPTSAQMALFTAASLSNREIEIAMYISEGFSDKDIAAKLKISPSTVAVHNKKIFKKLDIHSRLELISKTM